MAGVAGVGSAFLVVAAIELVAHAVYAPSVMPDISTPEAMAAYVGSMPLGAFLFVLAAYVAGTVVGGFVGIAIARRHAMRFAGLAGGLILLASIANFVAIPHPTWFVVATLSTSRWPHGSPGGRGGPGHRRPVCREVAAGTGPAPCAGRAAVLALALSEIAHSVERVTCATVTVRFQVPTIATSTSAARSRPAPRRRNG